MISNSIFSIAAAQAAAVESATGKVIMPTGNSILSNMIGLSYVGSLPEGQDITYGDVLQAVTQDSVEGPSEHTYAIGDMIESLTPLVASHISFVRNIVCPKVNEFEANVLAAVKRVEAINPMEAFDVTYVSAPDPTSNEDFMTLVKQFSDDNLGVPANLGYLPALSTADISKAMEVSSSSVNASIKRWITERGDEWLANVWHHYFANANTTAVGSAGANQFTGGFMGLAAKPAFQRMDIALALFLISRGLMDEPPEGVTISLNEWRDVMDRISRFAGAQVQHAAKQIDSSGRQGTLILNVDAMGRKITVNGTLFNSFVSTGGTIEEVLGAALSGKASTYSLDAFKDTGNNFRSIWDNFKAVSRSSLDTKATLQLRAEAKAAFANCVAAVNGDEAQLLTELNRDAASMIKRADAHIERLTLKELSCVSDLAIKLVAGIRFEHTPAEQFLTDMTNAEQAGCASPQEAAAIAAINYVCSYVASNLALGNK